MKYSGSVTIKKTDILDLLTTEHYIFTSEVNKDSKWYSFGRTSALEQILEEDTWCKIFNSEPLELYQYFQQLNRKEET